MSLLNPSGGNTSSDTIDWREDNVFDYNSPWEGFGSTRKNGYFEISGYFSEISPDIPNMSLSVPINSLKVDNAKLTVSLDSDNTTLTTNGVNNVVCLVKFYYASDTDENALDIATESFYPKYIFESDFIQDFTIITMQGGRELKRVDVVLSSTERSAIKVKDISLKFNKNKESTFSKETVDLINSMLLGKVIIPLWTDKYLEEHGWGSTLADGEIGRMDNFGEFAYVNISSSDIAKMKNYEENISKLEEQIRNEEQVGETNTVLCSMLINERQEMIQFQNALLTNYVYEQDDNGGENNE